MGEAREKGFGKDEKTNYNAILIEKVFL